MLAWMVTSGVSVILVLLVRRIFRGKISLRLQYALWLPVLVRLLIPINIIDTDMSILNLFPQIPESSEVSAPAAVQERKTDRRPGIFYRTWGRECGPWAMGRYSLRGVRTRHRPGRRTFPQTQRAMEGSASPGGRL